MAALYRHLKEAGGDVPSLASLHRVVRRDLEAGRVLPDRAVVRQEREEQQTREAQADLVRAGPGRVRVVRRRRPLPRVSYQRRPGACRWAGAQSGAARCAAVSVGLLRFI
ncbi:hypothetical protein AQJ84_27405 [Streptomyces resistomycificus]|uniref:Uncharacterized protein n=1 Tax=Streptomyces resistomycificus TaxID=67356 RepID=A0A0L8L4K5_9ACTN|nr:hypothetical protein ADK37_24615 [Streptomyces resistomycificus]KUN94403.1 hypothetical protein AQJ84_27405 [Streptomyces resistomycificus]